MLLRTLSLCIVSLVAFGCSDSPSQPEFINTSLSTSAVTQPGPVRCYVEAEFDWDQYLYMGTVSGDISGEIIFIPVGTGKSGKQEPGLAYHFAETWVIQDEEGNTLVAGHLRGLIPPNDIFAPFRTTSIFTARGRVTDASEEWSHLIGHTMFNSGEVSWGPPTIATGELRIN